MTISMVAPGFRFCPTDVELVEFYLKRKIMGKKHGDAISEIDLYSYPPWKLSEKSFLQSRDEVWYFFCPNDQKYSSGPRRNRSNGSGCWKRTGKDKAIYHGNRVVGMKSILIFHAKGSDDAGRTDWVMHEYTLTGQLAEPLLGSYVVCKVYKKSGIGPKVGEQYGAAFNEENWEDEHFHIPSGFPTILNSDSPRPGYWFNCLQDSLVLERTLLQVAVDDSNNLSNLQNHTGEELDASTNPEGGTTEQYEKTLEEEEYYTDYEMDTFIDANIADGASGPGMMAFSGMIADNFDPSEMWDCINEPSSSACHHENIAEDTCFYDAPETLDGSEELCSAHNSRSHNLDPEDSDVLEMDLFDCPIFEVDFEFPLFDLEFEFSMFDVPMLSNIFRYPSCENPNNLVQSQLDTATDSHSWYDILLGCNMHSFKDPCLRCYNGELLWPRPAVGERECVCLL